MLMTTLFYFYERWWDIPSRHRSAIVDWASFTLRLNGTWRTNASEELLTPALDILCVKYHQGIVLLAWYEIRRAIPSRDKYHESGIEHNLGTHFKSVIIFKYQIYLNNVISNFHWKHGIVCTFKKYIQFNRMRRFYKNPSHDTIWTVTTCFTCRHKLSTCTSEWYNKGKWRYISTHSQPRQ